MRVKPAPGLLLRHPVTKILHTEHDVIEVAENDLAFSRFLAQGDVVRVSDAEAKAPHAAPTKRVSP